MITKTVIEGEREFTVVYNPSFGDLHVRTITAHDGEEVTDSEWENICIGLDAEEAEFARYSKWRNYC